MKPEAVSAVEHYRRFLADHYAWMSGPFDEKVAHQYGLLVRSGVVLGATGCALDLGCGPGSQSVALAGLGFSVIAVDANAQLLAELQENAKGLPIRPVLHDLCDLASCSALPGQVDAAVCVGDILPHLPTTQCVTTLLEQISGLLAPGGRFVVSFRDLSEERYGLDRFVPVRGDHERVMTCFLEYEPQTVVVHDLIYVRRGEGWELRKSCYRKLRLSVAWVCAQMEAQGLTVVSQEHSAGVWNVTAAKP